MTKVSEVLKPYQRTAAVQGAQMGNFLLADQQGLGTTLETLATIVRAAANDSHVAPQWHLITSPSVAVETVWAAEVRRWLKDYPVTVVPLTGTLAQRHETLADLQRKQVAGMLDHLDHIFVLTNIESARVKPHWPNPRKPKTARYARYRIEDAVLPSLHKIVWDTVVVDECQRALIRTSGALTQTRAGFELLSKNSNRRIALSGTPMRGKPEQLWGTLHWLRPDVYTSYWKWVKNYFNLTSNGYSRYVLNGLKPGGENRLAEDLRNVMIRRTKAEVLSELPPKTYAGTLMDPMDEDSPLGIWLEPLPEQLRQIKELDDEGFLAFDGDEMMVNGTLANYTRQKQLANAVHTLRDGVLVPTTQSAKYEWLLNWLSEANGEKVIVASWSTSLIDVWAKALRAEGYSVSVLTGKTSQKERARMVQQFQETDEVQVFMLNKQAGGVALTLDAADYVVLVDEDTIPDVDEQVEDRAHRTSRIHNVTIYRLRCMGTQDEEVAWIAAARLDVQQYLLDGARGVQAARALYQQSKEK
jgi:SNF2 family DNA or RNA helicase